MTAPIRTLRVVVPFYDEPTTLEPCVRRVLAAPLPDGWRLAITLVDDHSAAAGAEAAANLVESLSGGPTPDSRTPDSPIPGDPIPGDPIPGDPIPGDLIPGDLIPGDLIPGGIVTLLRHASNRGKGAAVRSGFDEILSQTEGDPALDDDVALIQDADLEYDPRDYPALLAPLIAGDADAVFGNRWHGHVTRRGAFGVLHRLGNGSLTALSNVLTGLRVRDMECCYKAIPIRVLRRLRPMLTEDRFGIEPQIAATLARLGCRVAQVDVAYDPRGFGSGKKIRPRDAVAAVHVMLRERFRPPRATTDGDDVE